MRFTAFCSETDCDGTTYCAIRKSASCTEDVYNMIGGNYDVSEVVPEFIFYTRPEFRNLDKWEQNYYRNEGYCSLGARWQPWVEDDTIGIPALDHTNDPPLFTDDDMLQAQYERGW